MKDCHQTTEIETALKKKYIYIYVYINNKKMCDINKVTKSLKNRLELSIN